MQLSLDECILRNCRIENQVSCETNAIGGSYRIPSEVSRVLIR